MGHLETHRDDESVLTAADALAVVKAEAADLINLKLMKTGGLSGARTVDALCAAAGLRTMVGCMDEPELGIAAGLALALSSPTVAHADLDGAIGLIGDPTAGTLVLTNGQFFASERPGLGIEVDL